MKSQNYGYHGHYIRESVNEWVNAISVTSPCVRLIGKGRWRRSFKCVFKPKSENKRRCSANMEGDTKTIESWHAKGRQLHSNRLGTMWGSILPGRRGGQGYPMAWTRRWIPSCASQGPRTVAGVPPVPGMSWPSLRPPAHSPAPPSSTPTHCKQEERGSGMCVCIHVCEVNNSNVTHWTLNWSQEPHSLLTVIPPKYIPTYRHVFTWDGITGGLMGTFSVGTPGPSINTWSPWILTFSNDIFGACLWDRKSPFGLVTIQCLWTW